MRNCWSSAIYVSNCSSSHIRVIISVSSTCIGSGLGIENSEKELDLELKLDEEANLNMKFWARLAQG